MLADLIVAEVFFFRVLQRSLVVVPPILDGLWYQFLDVGDDEVFDRAFVLSALRPYSAGYGLRD